MCLLAATTPWAVEVSTLPPSHAPQSGPTVEAGVVFSDQLAGGDTGPEVVVVAARRFDSGTIDALWRNDRRPPQNVAIARAIAVGRTEVTVAQFRDFVSATGYRVETGCWHHGEDEIWRFETQRSWQAPGWIQTDAHPVTCISWYDARAYLHWLSAETHEQYRLPSEAEFELFVDSEAGKDNLLPAAACRVANGADVSSRFSYHNRACDDGYQHTAPAGSFGANALGLNDTRGNVWEWVDDCWTEGIMSWWYLLVSAPADGTAWQRPHCSYRVSRGGGWLSSLSNLEVLARRPAPPAQRLTSVGFRIVRELSPPAGSRP